MRACRMLSLAWVIAGSLFAYPGYGIDKPAFDSKRKIAGSETTGLPAAELNTVELLQQYIRLDTSNPPGREVLGADFFAAIFEQHGIAYQVAESEPGRANIWARLEGGDRPGVLLLHHMDVVPADASRWQYPPFEGRLVDAYVHGRGALDNKAAGIFHLQTFLALHAAGKALSRDVMFMATADEEAGGQLGVGWLIKHRPEIFEGIGGVLNEGGSGVLREGKLTFGIELTQKLPLWLKITATGEPGHGAVPLEDSAPRRLVRALARLEQLQFEARAIPAAATYLRSVAKDATPPWDKRLAALDELVASPQQMSELQVYDHRLYAQLTNTCALTRLQGSDKINVVPALASAEVDCRLLPDSKPDEEVLAAVTKAIVEEGVSVATSLSFGAGSSSTDNFVYKALEKVLKGRYPDAPVLPKLNAGFTDSHFFREKGIAAYGFSPVILDKNEISGVHGDNERISLSNLTLGSEVTREIIEELVYHQ